MLSRPMKGAPPPPALARVSLASIIVFGTLLATAWAFFVPMMQEPDESAHIDYAISLLTAHRISLAPGEPSTDVHPYTRYLESASGFRGMRYSSYGRVPPGYGTRAFFARVDAGAPRVIPPPSGLGLPLYARAYPFGFYALEAVVMTIAGRLIPGSLVAQFFATRLFCVALLVPTLLCSYGIFRHVRLSRTLALLLTASIAFFPLTSSTFSYVQPDDLVAALVTGSILAALRLRDRPSSRTAATVGILLAALALTKIHDALVLLPVVAFMALMRRPVLSMFAYVAGPAIVALAADAATIYLPATKHRLLCAAFGAPLHAALKAGPQALASYVANTSSNFFSSTFVSGWPFVEYWDAIGWIPHRIIIVSQAVTNGTLAVLGFATLVALTVMLMRAASIARRLASLARAGRLRAAARVLSNDVVLNAYVVYLGFMLAANVYGANFLQQGRYWLPFMFGALLCAVRYVPHFARPRFERPLATWTAVALALYSVVTALPALAVVERSYYVPRGSVPYVENFANFDRSTIERLAAGRIPRDGQIVVSGYAVDGPRETAARGASLLVDGKRRIPLRYGAIRNDVVCTFNDVSLARTGFRGTFSAAGLSPGSHSLELQVTETEFALPVSTPERISFTVGEAFAGRSADALDLNHTE